MLIEMHANFCVNSLPICKLVIKLNPKTNYYPSPLNHPQTPPSCTVALSPKSYAKYIYFSL